MFGTTTLRRLKFLYVGLWTLKISLENIAHERNRLTEMILFYLKFLQNFQNKK